MYVCMYVCVCVCVGGLGCGYACGYGYRYGYGYGCTRKYVGGWDGMGWDGWVCEGTHVPKYCVVVKVCVECTCTYQERYKLDVLEND